MPWRLVVQLLYQWCLFYIPEVSANGAAPAQITGLAYCEPASYNALLTVLTQFEDASRDAYPAGIGSNPALAYEVSTAAIAVTGLLASASAYSLPPALLLVLALYAKLVSYADAVLSRTPQPELPGVELLASHIRSRFSGLLFTAPPVR